MLVALQFPFTDVRPFLQGDTHQLSVPSWGNLNPTRDFVRSIGPIRERHKGAIDESPGEDNYCRVSRALRFDPSYQAVSEPKLAPLNLRRFCAFRRFMAGGRWPDGNVVARLEVGFGLRKRGGAKLEPSAEDAIACAISTLKLPVMFRANGTLTQVPLLGLRDLFDDLYLGSTTERIQGQKPAVQPWWFRPGLPLGVIEYAANGAPVIFPGGAKRVEALAAQGIELAYFRTEVSGTPIGLWLLALHSTLHDQELLRRLRINLFKLHAERQCIAEVLRLVRQKKIPVVRGTSASENLQAYLLEALNFLSRQSREGLPQAQILEASQEAQDLAQPGERERLLEELKKIRGNVLRILGDYLDQQTPSQPVKRDKIFVSYSHKDKKLFEEFKTMLAPAIQKGVVDLWDDTKIQPGQLWKTEIENAVAASKVAVLLVSENFLASPFITNNELPPLLKTAQTSGSIIFWVCLSASLYEQTEIPKYQAAHDVSKPLDQLKKPQRKAAWIAICTKLLQVAGVP